MTTHEVNPDDLYTVRTQASPPMYHTITGEDIAQMVKDRLADDYIDAHEAANPPPAEEQQ